MTVLSFRALALLAVAACWAGWPIGCAHAQTQLDWSVPSGCPDKAAVEQAIDRALDPAIKQHSPVEVEAEVEHVGSAYALRLSVRTRSGTSRERLEASDCALFVRVIALKVSLLATTAVDDTRAPPAAADSSGSARGACATRGSGMPQDACSCGAGNVASGAGTSEACGAAGAPRVWTVRAQAQLAAAAVPAPGLGVGLGTGFRLGALQLELLASYLFPRNLEFAKQPGVGGTFQAWAAGLRACGLVAWPAPLELMGCAGAEAGTTHGRGFGVSPANASARLAVALTAGIGATLPLSALWRLRADVDALFGLVRPDFYVRNLGVLHRAPGIGARGLFGIELRLP